MADTKTNKDKETVATVYPLTQHLEELRKRIVYIFICLLIVFIGVYSQGKELMNILMQPVLKFMPENSTMAPIILPDVTILGKVIGLIRKI